MADRPTCAQCCRAVDEFLTYRNEEISAGGAIVFEARCHGRRERVVWTAAEQAAAIAPPSFGVAFEDKPAKLSGAGPYR